MKHKRTGQGGQRPKVIYYLSQLSQNPNMAQSAKRPREELNEDDEICTQAAGTGKSTCVHPVKEPRMVNDGSTDGSPLVLQQKEDESSDAEEVMYVEEDLGEEDSIASEDIDEDDDGNILFGFCDSCVDNEVCKVCGNKDGYPPDYEVPPCLKVCSCGHHGEHWTGVCPLRDSSIGKCTKEHEEWKKWMLSRGRKEFCPQC